MNLFPNNTFAHLLWALHLQTGEKFALGSQPKEKEERGYETIFRPIGHRGGNLAIWQITMRRKGYGGPGIFICHNGEKDPSFGNIFPVLYLGKLTQCTWSWRLETWYSQLKKVPYFLVGFYCTFEEIRHEDGFTNLASGDSHRGVASKLSSSSRLINPHCSGSGSCLGASL